ncbi:MAG: DUF616 domain-containing protein [Alphaproteobacteria bacterium]|nr:DUF616 domain-containing protein [Alphaproteobacteria bacterium]
MTQTPKRLFLFAGYDPDGIIDNTLVYYLDTLSQLGDIVLVMDCDVADKSKLKNIKNLIHVSTSRHGEYDFGSYKRAFQWASKNQILDKYDWVYLINDSCYLLSSPEKMMLWLENCGRKIVGAIENTQWEHHLQSYFIGLSPEIFMTKWFAGFLDSIRPEEKNALVLHYEAGLSKLALDNGFSFGAYTSRLPNARSFDCKDRFIPLLKKNIITKDKKWAKKVNRLLETTGKDVRLDIKEHVKRTKNITIPFSKLSIIKQKTQEIFWDKQPRGKYKLFGISVYYKNLVDHHNKHIYIFPFNFRFHWDRRGLLITLWGIHLFRLHRKQYSATARQIKKWHQKHAKSNIRGVVYTVMTGNYDNIITHRYLNPEYDYICFTDNAELLANGHSVWQIKPLPFCDGDNATNSRFPKLNPHIALPKYDNSIYVDANVSIVSKHIFHICEKSNQKILIPRHPDRDCIYDETKAVYESNKDTHAAIFGICDLLRLNGYSRKLGLTENNIIYRRHNDKKVIMVDSMWWNMFIKKSHRDQLTFGYVLWKNKIPFQEIYMPIHQNWDFIKVSHNQ